ncbi:hypothetical protein OGZ02_06015 [Brachyspira hyodysenteriae]|nr:hypothetical protein [Brachyspira hyodysenteriae]MDA1468404.1 hypothetical protein [Brachyspira hyodysenteriae]
MKEKKIKDISDSVVDAACIALFDSPQAAKEIFMITKLIIGLGNPSDEYKNNRHNVGFILIDKIAENLSLNFDTNKKKSLYARGKSKDIEYILLKPQTFMNLSGEICHLYIQIF